MKKRLISALLVLAMLVCLVVPAANAANPFSDVQNPSSFYYTPVLWAVENDITAGMSATSFAPDATCTRGQIVTFLWRAAGKPAPTGTDNPFTDVTSKAFYYKAVLWAVENGITNGMSATTFEPDSPCTRGQVVTFLWRALGTPAPVQTSHPFTDVASNAFYYKAMLWAVENGITKGMSATTFAPAAPCTRGQIVTFLYRAYADGWTAPDDSIIAEFSGTGDQAFTGINVPKGDYYVEFTHQGNRNFIAKLYYGSGSSDYNLVANGIANCTGQELITYARKAAIQNGTLNVQADGYWTIAIKRVSGTTTGNISGTGHIVTGIFTASASGQVAIRCTHNGSNHFDVMLYPVGGNTYHYDLVANGTGSYNGSQAVSLVAGQAYFFTITAEGGWTIVFDQKAPLTTCSQPAFPEVPGGGEDGGEGGEDGGENTSDKYTYQDVKKLNELATSATNATTKAMENVNKSYSSTPAINAMYLRSALQSMANSQSYLENALSRMEGKVDIPLSNSTYATLKELVQANRDLLASAKSITVDENNVDAARTQISNILITAGSQNLAFQNVTVQLLASFN